MNPASRDKSLATFSILDALTVGVILATGAVTAVLYPRLPDPMPTHYDWAGRPNGWLERVAGAWVVLAIAIATLALVRVGAILMPKGWRERLQASPVRAITLSIAATLCACQILLLHAALSPVPRLGTEIWALVGGLFVALGLALPRTRRNPLIGVRTAFTLASDENWARTHRVAGYFLVVSGMVAAVAGLLGSQAVAIAALLVAAVGPVVWSWRIARAGPGDVPPIPHP
jgi:uncharacterized membrane protein